MKKFFLLIGNLTGQGKGEPRFRTVPRRGEGELAAKKDDVGRKLTQRDVFFLCGSGEQPADPHAGGLTHAKDGCTEYSAGVGKKEIEYLHHEHSLRQGRRRPG